MAWLPKIVSDGNSGAIICWTEQYRGADSVNNADWDIYAQRVDSGGNFVWQSQGVPVCSLSGSNSTYPAMISDGRGGAIVAWEDTRGGLGYTRVFAQRMDSLGNRLWPENGVLVCNQMSGYVELCSDGHGGAIIAYVDGRDQATTSDNIYAQRIDSAGNPVWQADGVPVCTADSIQFWPAIVNNNSNAIIAWQDYRSGNYDIYAQMIDSSGNLKWVVNGVSVHLPTGQQEQYPKIIRNKRGGAIISWADYSIYKTVMQSLDSNSLFIWNNTGINTLGGYNNIKPILLGGVVSNSYAAQYIDSMGNLQWGAGILLHGDTTGGQNGSTSDTLNNLFVVWDELRSSPFYTDQFAQKVNINGTLMWEPTGVPICTLPYGNETYPQITDDGLGGAICTWDFYHPESQYFTYQDILVQRVYQNGVPGGVGNAQPSISVQKKFNVVVYPNPFTDKLNIEYELPRASKIIIAVSNILGQRVKTIYEGYNKEGKHAMKWNGKDETGKRVSSGVYICTLESSAGSFHHKLLTIK
jgi:hypothetical protein